MDTSQLSTRALDLIHEQKAKMLMEECARELPVEDRYDPRAHPLCTMRQPDGCLYCTKPGGHSGDHVAHGSYGKFLARWPGSTPGGA